VEDKDCVAFALINLVQALEVMGRFDEALESSWEAVSTYRELGAFREEAYSLLLTCRVLRGAGRLQEVLEPANDALYLAQQIQDASFEEAAQGYVTEVEQAIGRAQQFQMLPPEAQQQQQQGGGAPVIPVWAQNQGQQGAAPAGGESQVAKTRQKGYVLDVRAGLDPQVIKTKIQTIAAGIMGFDDVAELEMDSPFMESGLTSSSSVLLRDELMAEMQGVNLPITLVFDYPSPNSVAEFIVEKTGG